MFSCAGFVWVGIAVQADGGDASVRAVVAGLLAIAAGRGGGFQIVDEITAGKSAVLFARGSFQYRNLHGAKERRCRRGARRVPAQ